MELLLVFRLMAVLFWQCWRRRRIGCWLMNNFVAGIVIGHFRGWDCST